MTTRRPPSRAASADRDPVVREVRTVRAKLLREFGGDYGAISAAAKAYADSIGVRWASDGKAQRSGQRRRAS